MSVICINPARAKINVTKKTAEIRQILHIRHSHFGLLHGKLCQQFQRKCFTLKDNIALNCNFYHNTCEFNKTCRTFFFFSYTGSLEIDIERIIVSVKIP